MIRPSSASKITKMQAMQLGNPKHERTRILFCLIPQGPQEQGNRRDPEQVSIRIQGGG